MPFNDDDVLQSNTGKNETNVSSFDVTLPSGTTAGSAVVLIISSATLPTTLPTGWVAGRLQASSLGLYYKLNVGAGEGIAGSTPYTFSRAGATIDNWYVEEIANVALVDAVDATTGQSGITAGDTETVSTGTTSMGAGLTTVAYAAWGHAKDTFTNPDTWSGYTNGFSEVVEVDSTTSGLHLAVARKFTDGATSTYSCTATLSTINPTDESVNALVLAFRSADSPIAAPLAGFWGFEWGTHAGLANTGTNSLTGASSTTVSGTFGTNYLVQAGSARNSNYGLRVVASASAAYVKLGTFSTKFASFGFDTRVVSGSGTVVVADVVNTIHTAHAQLVYNTSTTKFGVRAGSSGTISYQSGTTALNTWVWVDLGVDTSSSTFRVKWRIETGTDTYTDETEATLGGQSSSGSTFAHLMLGTGSSQTMTADYDNVVSSTYYAAHPLKVHEVKLLVPETTGASVSGTAANFNEFTANGTLAAFASTSGQRIDEVPPTISAASDGVVQVTAASSDYMNFPMTTYTCAADEIIAGVRMVCSEWGGTGTGTGTLGFRGYDGTTETTFIAASASYDADSLTTASSTYPLWKTALWTPSNGWTQAKLDAAALRIGFSTDATPDMGVSAAYLETAIRNADTYRTLAVGENDEFTVDLRVHPYNSATVSYVITNDDVTRDVTFDYSLAGTPQTPVVVTPGNSQEVVINADAFGDVSDITLTPEA